MYRKLLVPVEPGQVDKHGPALEMAENLADPEGSEITIVTVVEPVPGYIAQAGDLHEFQKRAADETLKSLKALSGDRQGVRLKVLHGHPATQILTHAEEIGADCIVVASHRPGLADYLIGSTAARLVRHATCSVHVMR